MKWFLRTVVSMALVAGVDGTGAAEISFRTDVMAVLSKAGCNAGACHGNASGKGGFKLSLRGEDADWDFQVLTRDLFARRTNPFDPDKSLILLKPTTQISHEGGLRFRKNSAEYEFLRGWIAAGAPDDRETAAKLVGLEVSPREKILVDPETEVQLKVTARFSSGSERDVSKLAVYDSANNAASIDHDGLARREAFGQTTVLVRYLDRQVPVRLAFIPARPGFAFKPVPARNNIDEQVFARLRSLRMQPSQLCTDNEFVRRAYLDLLGLLPTAAEAKSFVKDTDSDKRARLVGQLLERPEFADYWALKWSDLLRSEEKVLDRKGVENFHHWIRQSFAANKPLDQFVRELLAARGSTYDHPAANFYRANRDAVTRSEAVAQLFLGTRLQCAKCHNHPFDRWTQADYYDWADVFSRVEYRLLENRRRDKNDNHEFIGEQVVWMARQGEVRNPKAGADAAPRFLGTSAAIPDAGGSSADPDRLEALADWVTKNPLFARAQANRIWFHLMGRGIVDPIDDFRATNPASIPGLLEALARDFADHHFDVRYLVRVIMNSRTYQLSSVPNESNGDDEQNFSHALVQRLTAEQLLDAQNQVTGVSSHFNGYPVGMRAAQIPGVRAVRPRDRKLSGGDEFLRVFGKPPRLLTCECERSTETTMAQAFQLISGPTINELLAEPENRLSKLLASGQSDAAIIDELYRTALSRPPAKVELERAVKYLKDATDRRAALEDLTWALLNAKEFLLRR